MGPQLLTVRRVRPDVDRNIDAMLTRVIRLVSRLKKVSFHVQEERSVYVVTLLEAQLEDMCTCSNSAACISSPKQIQT